MAKTLLWLTENYPPQRGGMAQSCDRIIDGLRKAGLTIHIVHFTTRKKGYVTDKQLDGTYMAVPFDENEAHTLNRCWATIKHIKDIDNVVCFGGYLPMLAAPVYAKWLKVKLTVLLRGNDFDQSLFTPRKRIILEDALKSSSQIATVSGEKKTKIDLLYPGLNVTFTPNGIDTSNWAATSSELDFTAKWRAEHCPDKICIGLFGDLKAKKGVSFFLESMKVVDTTQLHLLLIGELGEELQEQLAIAGCSYTHIDFLDRYQLLPFYLCCDAMAIPSFYDGMPNVLLEAGALGIPVIGSDVDGMADVLVDEENGLLFEAANTHDCRKALYRFLQMSQEARTTLGANLKSTIHSKFEAAHETQHYLTLFKN